MMNIWWKYDENIKLSRKSDENMTKIWRKHDEKHNEHMMKISKYDENIMKI